MAYSFTTLESPVGELKLIASEAGLAAILWENDDPKRVRLAPLERNDKHPVLLETKKQLNDYFAGARQSFDLPLHFEGTDFQKSVWSELLKIPYGQTLSYGDIARRIGNEKAVRAVGAANGKNPLSIVAPCHRVVGANGSLTGFAGGLTNKSYLLKLEGRT